ncbi:PAS domain S-box protein [Rhodopirellula sp. P2]|uniref:PAS domain S-box protein n=1 Tax=Rhodopirellula sp. P2 TaxID=2127060 RepID=UPI0023679E19|nr:PAS domain S-box protein [Rhodopirellula sp. P2]WDQ15082.1 PAS domain S-box protein [Rhodopirellula sp. P2]
MASNYRDTERRESEQRIDVAHQPIVSLGNALDEFEIGFVCLDVKTTRLRGVNAAFAKMLGRDVATLHDVALGELVENSDQSAFESVVQSLAMHSSKRISAELPIARSDGSQVWLRFTFVGSHGEHAALGSVNGTVIDVSPEKELEAALLLANDRFDSAQATSRVGSWEWAVGETTAWWSKQLYELHNIDPSTGPISFDEFIVTVDPNDHELIITVNQEPFPEGDVRRFSFASNPAHGPQRHFNATVWMTKVNGKLVRRGTTQDVTRQVELLSALEKSEDQYREMVVSNTEGNAVMNLDGKVLQVDETFASMLGTQPESLNGLNLCELAESESAALIDQRMLHRTHSATHEVRLRHADGHLVWLLLTCSPLLNDSEQFVGIQTRALDINHRKHVELLTKRAAEAKARLRRLTSREREVLQQIVEGRMNKVIANRLDISEKTVERHRSNLMKKLNAHSVAELVKISLTAEIMSA